MIRLLLRLYPEAWRKEYGDELAETLRLRQLTARIAANVAAGAMRQRLRYTPPSLLLNVFRFTVFVSALLLQLLAMFAGHR